MIQDVADRAVLDALAARWIQTPLGRMLAVADERTLRYLEFRDPADGPDPRVAKFGAELDVPGDHPLLETVEREVDAYFAGQLTAFSIPVAPRGTTFEQRAWAYLQRIPFGVTRSYGQQARAIAAGNAARAVGRANGANPIGLIIPCHRVIGADGSLTGYGGGMHRKRWLLDHERRFGSTEPGLPFGDE